ncbi:MAG: hypothetical protein ABIO70_23315 [Pseudomonadota bacterium]
MSGRRGHATLVFAILSVGVVIGILLVCRFAASLAWHFHRQAAADAAALAAAQATAAHLNAIETLQEQAAEDLARAAFARQVCAAASILSAAGTQQAQAPSGLEDLAKNARQACEAAREQRTAGRFEDTATALLARAAELDRSRGDAAMQAAQQALPPGRWRPVEVDPAALAPSEPDEDLLWDLAWPTLDRLTRQSAFAGATTPQGRRAWERLLDGAHLELSQLCRAAGPLMSTEDPGDLVVHIRVEPVPRGGQTLLLPGAAGSARATAIIRRTGQDAEERRSWRYLLAPDPPRARSTP